MTLGFSSPWSPPLAGFDRVARAYPDLRFRLRARCPDGARVRSAWDGGERVEGQSPEVMPGITVERLVLSLLYGGDLHALLVEMDARRAAAAAPAPTVEPQAAECESIEITR